VTYDTVLLNTALRLFFSHDLLDSVDKPVTERQTILGSYPAKKTRMEFSRVHTSIKVGDVIKLPPAHQCSYFYTPDVLPEERLQCIYLLTYLFVTLHAKHT